MWNHVLAVLGLGALCGAWVVVQRWVSRHDPGAPGVEGCSSCSASDSCSLHSHGGGHHHVVV